MPSHNARLVACFEGFPSRRRFGGGAISMNSNEPGDTLCNAAAISAILGRMLGPNVRSEDDHRDFPTRHILLVLNVPIARQHDLAARFFGASDQIPVRDLCPALIVGIT